MPFTPVTGQKVTAGSMASSTSHALSYPSFPTVGSLQTLQFDTDANTAITPPTGWAAGVELGNGAVGKVGIYARITQVSDPKTITITQTAAGFADMCLNEYTDNGGAITALLAAVMDVSGSATVNPGTHLPIATSTPNAGVPAQPDELFLVVVETGGNDGGSLTWGSSGFTTDFDTFGGGFGHKNVNATPAVVTADPTWPNSLLAIGVILGFKAIVAGKPKVYESGSMQKAPLNAYESGTFTGKQAKLKEYNGSSWNSLL